MRHHRFLTGLFVGAIATGAAFAGKPDPHATIEPGPKAVGQVETIEVVPRAGATRSLGPGRRLWSETIYWPGASLLKVRFVDFALRPGDVLVVRAGSGREIERLTGRGPRDRGTFWSLTAFEDTLHLELEHRAPYEEPPFRVDRVLVGEPGLFDDAPAAPESVCAPADYDDVICYEDEAGKWANVLASVGVMTLGGNPATGLWCSGSNVSPNNYVMTNYHCIPEAGSCANSEFVFKFYRTACNTGAPPTADYQSFRCDETVVQSPIGDCDATTTTLDFSLNSVIGDPAATFGYVRPDPTRLTDGEAIYIVQHPAGRPHEIAHGDDEDVVVDPTAGKSVIRYYDTLDTEGGSSGSPIFRESDDQMVGLHHCGGCETPGIGNRGMLMSDIYPLIEDYLCTDALSMSAPPASDLVEVAGNGDGLLDPGETWSFVPRVRNASCSSDATGVEAAVGVGTGSSPGITLLDTVASFGAIAAGEIALAASPIEFELDGSFPCGGEAIFDLTEITANEGGPFGPVAGILSANVGQRVYATAFSESFEVGIPGSWSVVDGGSGGGAAATWTTANPGGRAVGLLEPFAIVDSDEAGSSATQDEQLITPAVDLTGWSDVELAFAHNFRWYSLGEDEKCDVDVRSTATGGSWVNVARFEDGDATGQVALDVTTQLAGTSDAQVRFRYHTAQFEWWWAVDDVSLRADLGDVCYPWTSDQVFVDDFETGSSARWFSQIP